MELEELQDKIYDSLIEKSMYPSEMEDTINQIVDDSIQYVDTNIDDGCDDDDDEYVMRICFFVKKYNFDVLVYYGNNTYKIGCVTFRNY